MCSGSVFILQACYTVIMTQRLSHADAIKTAIVRVAGRLIRDAKSPENLYGDLFHDVQMQQLFPDGKTFVDLVPRLRANAIVEEYELLRDDPNFKMDEFIARHFYEFAPHRSQAYTMSPDRSPRQHVTELWPQLLRRNRKTRGSLLALPYPYVVPGGRFSEQFYWDTYFIMLGLAADEEWDLVDGMVKNYAFMIKKYGFIPTANRSYFLSRSQPPFFSHMVRLLATHQGEAATYFTYLPYLLAEYRFWMKGKATLQKKPELTAVRRVVRMQDGSYLNRYYDHESTPRPESQREDIETAAQAEDKSRLFLDLRAGAESGWDFSSRWFNDPQKLETIHTTDIVPIDLNCLLYDLETLIAEIYKKLRQSGLARKFQLCADEREAALRHYCWSKADGYFYDFDYMTDTTTRHKTAAAAFVLYSGIATDRQAIQVAATLEKEFLCDGGLCTTTVVSGQQWDAPNGWAPLQWVAIQGLRRYGHSELANNIKQRWMKSVEYVFSTQHKMIEKYDVVHASRVGGGGEYPLQDGFGWTNGVYAALYDEQGH